MLTSLLDLCISITFSASAAVTLSMFTVLHYRRQRRLYTRLHTLLAIDSSGWQEREHNERQRREELEAELDAMRVAQQQLLITAELRLAQASEREEELLYAHAQLQHKVREAETTDNHAAAAAQEAAAAATIAAMAEKSPDECAAALAAMSPQVRAAAVARMSPRERASTLAAMSPEERATALAAMSPEAKAAAVAAMTNRNSPTRQTLGHLGVAATEVLEKRVAELETSLQASEQQAKALSENRNKADMKAMQVQQQQIAQLEARVAEARVEADGRVRECSKASLRNDRLMDAQIAELEAHRENAAAEVAAAQQLAETALEQAAVDKQSAAMTARDMAGVREDNSMLEGRLVELTQAAAADKQRTEAAQQVEQLLTERVAAVEAQLDAAQEQQGSIIDAGLRNVEEKLFCANEQLKANESSKVADSAAGAAAVSSLRARVLELENQLQQGALEIERINKQHSEALVEAERFTTQRVSQLEAQVLKADTKGTAPKQTESVGAVEALQRQQELQRELQEDKQSAAAAREQQIEASAKIESQLKERIAELEKKHMELQQQAESSRQQQATQHATAERAVQKHLADVQLQLLECKQQAEATSRKQLEDQATCEQQLNGRIGELETELLAAQQLAEGQLQEAAIGQAEAEATLQSKLVESAAVYEQQVKDLEQQIMSLQKQRHLTQRAQELSTDSLDRASQLHDAGNVKVNAL